jgi:hypothetical protein
MKQEHIFYLFDLKNPDKDIKEPINKDISEKKIVDEVSRMLSDLDESTTFSSMTLYYMRTKRLSTKDLYERAYIDRRLFHKIIKNRRYHPSKKTVFALCIAFRLDYPESIELLGLASYSFASNNKGDMILKYFLSKRIYDIDMINSVLYQFKCPCIGD